MHYFTYDLIAASNDWIEQSATAQRAAEQRLDSVFREYLRQLDKLENRISRPAFQFFRYGFGSDSLHDARLLSLRVGDGLDYTPDGSRPFYLNRQRTSAIVVTFAASSNAMKRSSACRECPMVKMAGGESISYSVLSSPGLAERSSNYRHQFVSKRRGYWSPAVAGMTAAGWHLNLKPPRASERANRAGRLRRAAT